jgi:hypothetical protein
MGFHFDERKSGSLRANPKGRIGFEAAQEVFSHPYCLDQRSDSTASRALHPLKESVKVSPESLAHSFDGGYAVTPQTFRTLRVRGAQQTTKSDDGSTARPGFIVVASNWRPS